MCRTYLLEPVSLEGYASTRVGRALAGAVRADEELKPSGGWSNSCFVLRKDGGHQAWTG